MTLMVTAQQAAEKTGYGTEARFRSAVARKIMPPPADPYARPQLWSLAQIEAALAPKENRAKDDVSAIDRALGL